MLLVEQHVRLVLEYADRAYVLVHGDLVMSGAAADLIRDPDTLRLAYLGGRSAQR